MGKLVVLVVFGVGLAGCGAIAERAAEEVAEQAIEQAAEGDGEGDVDIELGGGDLPGGLTVELPDGYTVLGSTSFSDDSGSFVNATVTYPGGDFESVVAHFDDSFADAAGVAKQEMKSDGVSTYLWSAEDGSVIVGVTYTDGEADVTVNVTESTQG